jgi:hypothetical protein
MRKTADEYASNEGLIRPEERAIIRDVMAPDEPDTGPTSYESYYRSSGGSDTRRVVIARALARYRGQKLQEALGEA